MWVFTDRVATVRRGATISRTLIDTYPEAGKHERSRQMAHVNKVLERDIVQEAQRRGWRRHWWGLGPWQEDLTAVELRLSRLATVYEVPSEDFPIERVRALGGLIQERIQIGLTTYTLRPMLNMETMEAVRGVVAVGRLYLTEE